MPLTDKQIKALKPEAKARKYFDGGGLLTVYQSDPCSIITSLSDPTIKVSQLLKTCVIRLDLLDNLA